MMLRAARPIAIAAVMSVIGASCDPELQPLSIVGVWEVKETGLQLRVDDVLEAELCVPALNVMVRLGVLSIERDVFDRYHFKTTLLDSALNTEVPLSLVGAFNPAEMTLGRALGHVEYVLRFCKATGELGKRELTCGESGLEGVLTKLTESEDPEATNACELPTVCRLGGQELFPDVTLTLADCLKKSQNASCLPSTLSDATALCDVIEAARGCPDALQACLASRVADTAVLGNISQAESACEAMGTLESLEEVQNLAFSTCDQLPADTLARELCARVESFVTTTSGNSLLEAVGDACALHARIDDIDLLCCRAGDSEPAQRRERLDARIDQDVLDVRPPYPDAGVDAAPDAPVGTCNPACTLPQMCCAATSTCTLPLQCL